MKKLVFIMMILLPAVMHAQLRFTLTGKGKGFKNGDKIYLVYKSRGTITADSVTVANHTFTFKGTVTGRPKASMYKNESPDSEVVHDLAHIYLEAGHIFITTPDLLVNAKITGTPTNVDMMTLSAALKAAQNRQSKVLHDFEALTTEQKSDIKQVSGFRAALKQTCKDMEPIQFEFIKSHPQSYISLVTLSQLARNKDIMQQVAAYYDYLTPALKQTDLGKDVCNTITASIKSSAGITAMDFSQPDTSGKAIKLSDFKGKYVLIDFWASWCAPCRAENPFIKAAYEKYKSKGFTVISISLDDEKSQKEWLKAIKDDRLTWVQVSDLKGFKNAVATTYGITLIPANILVDPLGKIIARDVKDQTLHQTLAGLLGSASN